MEITRKVKVQILHWYNLCHTTACSTASEASVLRSLTKINSMPPDSD